MTTPTTRQGLAPSILVFKPSIDSSTSPVTYAIRGEYVTTLTDQIASYTHTINAVGGYWNASLVLTDTQNRIEDWIETGVGRHIEVQDHSQNRIFQGIVNTVIATVGPLTITRGPLLDVGNRASVIYSTVDTSTVPPTLGIRARTASASNAASIAKYGRLSVFLSAGGMTADTALEVRNQWLAERGLPRTTQTFTLGSIGAPSLQIDIVGYVQMMQKYYYNNDAGTGTVNASAKIQDIIDDQPNTIIDTGYDEIDTNTLQVQDYQRNDDKALDAIKGVLAQGDVSDNRWLFGVYGDNVPQYNQAPSTIEYFQRLTDDGQRIFDASGVEIKPWNVLPGKWILFTDAMIGRIDQSSDLREDPRAMFIESVQFTMPQSLTMQGGLTDTLNQKLAKLGLAGVGA